MRVEVGRCYFPLLRATSTMQHGSPPLTIRIGRLVVLIDWRRPDLLQQWWKAHGAIKNGDLRSRCEVHFWQEVAMACEPSHRKFLTDKYGL